MFPGAHNHYDLNLERFANSSEIAHYFVSEHLHFFASAASYFSSSEAQAGDETIEYYNIDTEAFVKAFVDLLDQACEQTNRIAWICAHLAFAKVCGQDPSMVRYLFIHNHIKSPDMIASYFRDFPDLYYIAPTRDTREEWSSGQKLIRQRFGDIRLFDQFLEFLKGSSDIKSNMLASYGRCIDGHCKIVDLARLHLLQDDAMKQLAAWLGIAYVPCLSQSTIMGIAWLGNASDGKPIAGFDRSRAKSKYQETLSPTERDLIDYFFSGMIEVMGYETPSRSLDRKEIYRKIFFRPEPIAWRYRRDKKELIDLWCRQSPSRTSRLINSMLSLSRILPFRLAQKMGYAYLILADLSISVSIFLRRYSLKGLRQMENVSNQFRQTDFDRSDLL
jgi:hypothetical protein